MKGSYITIFGGTGSIGSALVEELLPYKPLQILIYTNDENSLWEAKQRWKAHECMKYMLGDIRDYNLVHEACFEADYVFNCAAIKHVPICEENPEFAYDVNVNGLQMILNANPARLVHISTDKAVEPTSVMGTTKKLGERLVLKYGYKFVRFGNVLGSRGSIVPIVMEKLQNGRVIPLTHPDMKRYFITMSDAAKFIIKVALDYPDGFGYVPRGMKQVKIIDMIRQIAEEEGYTVGDYRIEIIGIREGEKVEELLVSEKEYYTEDKEVYIIK